MSKISINPNLSKDKVIYRTIYKDKVNKRISNSQNNYQPKIQ